MDDAPEPPRVEGPVEQKVTELSVERPAVGLAFLLLGPLLPLVYLIDRAVLREEQPHESWTFRYHDWAARNPELGLLALILGCCSTLAAGIAALLVLGKLHAVAF